MLYYQNYTDCIW